MRQLLFDTALLSLFTASLSVFLEFCLREGNILGFWTNWIEYINSEYVKKPLGSCIYCFGTWVFIVFYLVTLPQNCHLEPRIIGLLLGIGVNHIFVSLLTKIEDL